MDEKINKELEQFNFENVPSLSDDAIFKIVETLRSFEHKELFSDLSCNEIKNVIKVGAMGNFFNDRIRTYCYEKYILLKISKEGKGRDGLEKIGIAGVERKQSWMSRNIYNKFKPAQG